MRKLYISLLVPLLFLSCEKDINIDYRQIDPIYVVEAYVSDKEMGARITTTNDMDDNLTIGVIDAKVSISGSDSTYVELDYQGDGYYKDYFAKGTPGVEYTINIEVDGHHFSSTSTMQKMPAINKFRFVWKDMMQEKFLMGELLFQDIPNEENWYFAHIYRNKSGYRWATKRDDVDPNRELQQLFTIARKGSDDDDMLREGDKLHIELRAIDQRAYDYLYSMQIMDNTGTNPIQNFTGGCLGYFSAYSEVTYDCVFHEADVEEEEE